MLAFSCILIKNKRRCIAVRCVCATVLRQWSGTVQEFSPLSLVDQTRLVPFELRHRIENRNRKRKRRWMDVSCINCTRQAPRRSQARSGQVHLSPFTLHPRTHSDLDSCLHYHDTTRSTHSTLPIHSSQLHTHSLSRHSIIRPNRSFQGMNSTARHRAAPFTLSSSIRLD